MTARRTPVRVLLAVLTALLAAVAAALPQAFPAVARAAETGHDVVTWAASADRLGRVSPTVATGSSSAPASAAPTCGSGSRMPSATDR